MIKFNPTYIKTLFIGALRPTFVQKNQKPNGSILSNNVSALVHTCEL